MDRSETSKYRNELELERRLNAIASKAVRETTPSSNHSVQSGPDYGRVSSEIPDASASLRELQLEAQVAKISTNAIKQKLGWKPSKIKSETTAEMIADYQAEMTKPLELRDKYGQPVYEKEIDGSFRLDDAGKKIPVLVRYHPSSLDIDLEEFVPDPTLTPDQKAGIEEQRRNFAKEIEKQTANLRSLDTEKEQLGWLYDQEMAKIRALKWKKSADRIKTLLSVQDMFVANKARIEAEKEARRTAIVDLTGEIARYDAFLQQNKDTEDANRVAKTRADRINAAKLKAYTEDLNLLNRGRLNVKQEPGESDEDFKQRLLETGQMTVSPDTIEASAEQYNRDKLRERMKELTRDSPTASTVVKSLETDEVFAVIKKWFIIKTEFLKVYGFDNKTLGAADFVEFFKNMIAYSPAALAAEAAGKLGVVPPPAVRREAAAEDGGERVVPEAPARVGITRAEWETLNKDRKRNWLTSNYPRIAGITSKTTVGQLTAIAEANNAFSDAWGAADITGTVRPPPPREVVSPPLGSSLNTFESIRARMESELIRWVETYRAKQKEEQAASNPLAASIFETIADGAEAALGASTIAEFYAGLDEMETQSPNIIKNRFPDLYPRALTGLGANLQPIKHELPTLIEFGKVKISPKKLYYNNTLVVKHKSGSSFTGIPNVRVSDQFVNIIFNLLKGKKPTMKDFQSLDLSEKGIFDTLIYSAGLGKEVDNTFNETKQQLKDRLQLVEGEVGAGNTNPALKKEMFYLLNKMAHTGLVGYGDARRHFASFFPK
jgi:hypothetical protein